MKTKEENMLDISLDNGKYRVIMSNTFRLQAQRYGEFWRDCCGDNLILSLATEVETLREKIKAAENCLVCAAIADPMEVIQNSLEILKRGQE